MTGAAHMPLLALEQICLVPGVRRMAGKAAVVAETHQMVVGRSHLLTDLGVAIEAGVHGDGNSTARVARLAAGGIRRMQDIADQMLPVAAVGAVAGTAVYRFSREVGMFLPDALARMAAQTESSRLLGEQGRLVRLMRAMAGRTLAIGIGSVGIFELLGQSGVAGKTGFRGSLAEQSAVIG